MSLKRCCTLVVAVLLISIIQGGLPGQAQGTLGRHRMIDLYPTGPRPQALTVPVGMPVVWQSHLAHTKRVVVTVAFLKGEAVAQATQPVEGMNRFVLEDGHFVGRMEANGGMVALRFVTPGEYTYTLGHRESMPGTIVVRP